MVQIHFLNNGRYCSSKDLHNVLALNSAHYARDVKKWLTSTYLFQGKKQLSKPVSRYDYILAGSESHSPLMVSADNQQFNRLTQEGRFADEFMIRLELVKLITLHGKSKVKDVFVQWLLSLEDKYENHELVSPDLIYGLMELAHLCTYMDNQIQYYKDHKQTWQDQIEGKEYYEFDVWRNSLLQIDNASAVKATYKTIGRIGNLSTKREQLSSIDAYKGIRDAIFDYLKIQYSSIDYFFPESNEKSLTLANMTERIMKIARKGERPDIKPRGYQATAQFDLWREDKDVDIVSLSSMITRHIIASVN